jgi:hypothetical protein
VFLTTRRLSAIGTKRTLCPLVCMSAFLPKADPPRRFIDQAWEPLSATLVGQ